MALLRPLTAAAVLSDAEAPVSWVWRPFLAAGTLNVLAAYMKVGKTTLAYPLAVAVAQGQPFLDYPTAQGAVLILAVEEHPREVKRRLRRFGLRREDPLTVHVGPLPPSPLLYRELQEYVTAHDVRLILLDTISTFWQIENENDNAQITTKLSPLLALARETGAAVLLLHHERKTGGKDGKGIRGGGALFAMVDQAITVNYTKEGRRSNRRVVEAFGRFEGTPEAFLIALHDNQYTRLPDGV